MRSTANRRTSQKMGKRDINSLPEVIVELIVLGAIDSRETLGAVRLTCRRWNAILVDVVRRDFLCGNAQRSAMTVTLSSGSEHEFSGLRPRVVSRVPDPSGRTPASSEHEVDVDATFLYEFDFDNSIVECWVESVRWPFLRCENPHECWFGTCVADYSTIRWKESCCGRGARCSCRLSLERLRGTARRRAGSDHYAIIALKKFRIRSHEYVNYLCPGCQRPLVAMLLRAILGPYYDDVVDDSVPHFGMADVAHHVDDALRAVRTRTRKELADNVALLKSDARNWVVSKLARLSMTTEDLRHSFEKDEVARTKLHHRTVMESLRSFFRNKRWQLLAVAFKSGASRGGTTRSSVVNSRRDTRSCRRATWWASWWTPTFCTPRRATRTT
eukprot:Opistho-1_new@3409